MGIISSDIALSEDLTLRKVQTHVAKETINKQGSAVIIGNFDGTLGAELVMNDSTQKKTRIGRAIVGEFWLEELG